MAHIRPRTAWDIVAEVKAAGSCEVDGAALRFLRKQQPDESLEALWVRHNLSLRASMVLGTSGAAFDLYVFTEAVSGEAGQMRGVEIDSGGCYAPLTWEDASTDWVGGIDLLAPPVSSGHYNTIDGMVIYAGGDSTANRVEATEVCSGWICFNHTEPITYTMGQTACEVCGRFRP